MVRDQICADWTVSGRRLASSIGRRLSISVTPASRSCELIRVTDTWKVFYKFGQDSNLVAAAIFNPRNEFLDTS